MKIELIPPHLPSLKQSPHADAIVCSVYSDERPFQGLAALVDWWIAGRLSQLAKQQFFIGQEGDILLATGKWTPPLKRIFLLGLGPRCTFNTCIFENSLRKIHSTLIEIGITQAIVELPGRGDNAIPLSEAIPLFISFLTVISPTEEQKQNTWWVVEHQEGHDYLTEQLAEYQRRRRRFFIETEG
ncbi:M17 family peptidase N-terminal domain-containing protein [Pajaroellobacter abortibovis]|uniref:Peptidase M17 leucyl aminopeptidase N-terminal domain-containing protein n=1 Tax=Pajaroellobacter abortibovis TaxID=1882918 RepID=A0A1L6MVS7_9BACT|nr:M17 family peptidase N-terminal domain-containing protein [Pajaroellobacter abortibovis]APR99527.1 hypothetical protein BCY86_01655 [Pajaroellobacter abortibovis]